LTAKTLTRFHAALPRRILRESEIRSALTISGKYFWRVAPIKATRIFLTVTILVLFAANQTKNRNGPESATFSLTDGTVFHGALEPISTERTETDERYLIRRLHLKYWKILPTALLKKQYLSNKK
jgi:hypothetical protein